MHSPLRDQVAYSAVAPVIHGRLSACKSCEADAEDLEAFGYVQMSDGGQLTISRSGGGLLLAGGGEILGASTQRRNALLSSTTNVHLMVEGGR